MSLRRGGTGHTKELLSERVIGLRPSQLANKHSEPLLLGQSETVLLATAHVVQA
jgi:hypothetical protein